MRIVYEKVLGPIVLSSDAATMTKDRPAYNVFLARLLLGDLTLARTATLLA